MRLFPIKRQRSKIPSSKNDIDLTLKRLDKWIKLIGIIGAIVGLALTAMSIWNLHKQNSFYEAQQLLLQRQGEAEGEKRRVNVKMELKPFNGPIKNGIYLVSTLTNSSARQIDIAMLGMRIWNQYWRSDIEDNPEYLVYSDNLIAN